MTDHNYPTMAITTIDLGGIVDDFLGRIKDEILSEFRADLLAEVDRRIAAPVNGRLDGLIRLEGDRLHAERALWGGRLPRILAERAMTYKDFAEQVGVSGASMGRFASGRRKPHVSVHVKMLRALNFTADELAKIDPIQPGEKVHSEPRLSAASQQRIDREVSRRLPRMLRAYREKTGSSVASVAQQIGVHKETLYSWERGDTLPSLSRLGAVLDALQTTRQQVLGRTNYARLIGGAS